MLGVAATGARRRGEDVRTLRTTGHDHALS